MIGQLLSNHITEETESNVRHFNVKVFVSYNAEER